jgi:1,4-alpha-glucan branching enzyme
MAWNLLDPWHPSAQETISHPPMTSPWTAADLDAFRDGTHADLARLLGAHLEPSGGARFAVWAPNAEQVSVVGDFNGWQHDACPLTLRADGSGIWEGVAQAASHGMRYKYRVIARGGSYAADKGDPFAFAWETPPGTASRIWDLSYDWSDEPWMAERRSANALDAPWSIYELHAGSWLRRNGRPISFREIAQPLLEHVSELGYTHVELMPLMEHPAYASWGYQTVGYFAPTSRYGTPQDLKYLIDRLHQHGIGVVLDWVPTHFPDDLQGLKFFDGTPLYEPADRGRGYQPQWHRYEFDYDRNEVRAFLTSSALFWLGEYHADAIRIDGLSSMLYLDQSRERRVWAPSEHGRRENLAAVRFLRELNTTAYRQHPDTQMIAEESTAWPRVSRPVEHGGLGFGLCWNSGWAHDTLDYFATDPLFRKYRHRKIAAGVGDAFAENFVLPLSHDEVVHGKRSLLGKMPGDDWQQFANLRALLGYQYLYPGKKLAFMGAELGVPNEWSHEHGIDWSIAGEPLHADLYRWIKDLNSFYRAEPALWQQDFSAGGFEWIDCEDADNSVLAFLRKDVTGRRIVLAIVNFTPVPRPSYQLGVPRGGYWQEVLNSDALLYGGSGQGNLGGVQAAPTGMHGRYHSVSLALPPLAVIVLRNAASESHA